MTHDKEIETFQTHIQSIPEVKTLVDTAAQDAEFQASTAGTRGFDPLLEKLTEMFPG